MDIGANTPGVVGKNSPKTSRIAAGRVRTGSARMKCFTHIAANEGIIRQHLYDQGILKQTADPRVWELLRDGLIEVDKYREGITPSGNPAEILVISDLGQELVTNNPDLQREIRKCKLALGE